MTSRESSQDHMSESELELEEGECLINLIKLMRSFVPLTLIGVMYRSKRQAQIAQIEGEVGSDGKPKGQVGYNQNGEMYYRENDHEEWRK